MANGIDFTGNGSEDAGSGPASTGTPEKASRGAMGPIQLTGNGDADVGGTIADTSERGTMPPKGGGVEFTGDVGDA